MQTSDCFIGLESIPDDENQYRLGRVFLRNFYTGLDYDQNLIMIGPNAYSSKDAKAYINGKVKNPNKKKHHSTVKWGWLVVILIGLLAGGVYMYIRHAKKLKESDGGPKISFKEETLTERMDNMTERLDSGAEEESFEENKDNLAIN